LDPLAQLSDIHLPPPISQSPIAIGWWLLALLIVFLLIFGAISLHRYNKQRKTKRQALKQLKKNSQMCVEETLLLIKWAALKYFPRQQCANLYGKKLQNFLLATLPDNTPEAKRQNFSEQLAQCVTPFEQVYQKNGGDIVDENVNKLAISWLTTALPPKKTTSKNNITTISQDLS